MTERDLRHPVIVGVDGSPGSAAAADWAADYAAGHGAPLRCVCGVHVPSYARNAVGMVDGGEQIEKQISHHAEQMLADTVDRLRREHPRLTAVTAYLVAGSAAHVLIEESRRAAATVVGARGGGGFSRLKIGSVSGQVAAHAYGPVIVVRPPTVVDAPILVGIDGSEYASRALAYAAEQAALRHAELQVLTAYTDVPHPKTAHPAQEGLAQAQRFLDDVIADYHHVFPDLRIRPRPEYSGWAGETLVNASEGMALTVVGCRGHGGLSALLLGSVSRELVYHGHSPVAVIHAPAHSS